MNNKPIKRGHLVRDKWGHKGVVVEIKSGHSIEDHGSILVWQLDRKASDESECELYVYIGWQNILTVLEE